MARESRIEIKVGALIVVCLVILIAFFLLLGNITFGESELIEIDWRVSGGLREGAPVKVVGLKAGRVESVEYRGGQYDEAVGRPVYVRVKISIKPELRDTLRKDAQFYLTTLGLLGEKYVEIDPGAADEPLPEGIIPEGVPPMRMEVMAANINKTLSTATRILADNEEKIGKTLDDISKAAEAGREAIDEGRGIVTDLRQTLRKVEGRALGLIDNADAAIVEYTPGKGQTGNDVKRVMASGANLAESLDKAVGDGRQVKAVLDDARQLSGTARRVIDEVGSKAIKVANRVDGLVGKADGLVVETKDALAESRGKLVEVVDSTLSLITVTYELAGLLKDGKGTLGALLNDREMFDDARELMKNLKRHPWKFLWKE